MPFQDLDEVSTTEYSRSPGVIESWLRKIFIENWGLKLLALGITLVLWLAVTGVNKPVTIRTGVQLNLVAPDNLEISNDPPRTVDVLLTGRRSNLDKISTLDLVATVDVSDQSEGQRVVRLSADRVHIELPDGVKIESFQPSTIPIQLESVVERELEVHAKLVGKPAEGLEAYVANVSPDRIKVRGPASHVNALQEAPTETISVDGKKGDFTVSRVGIDIADSKVDLLTSAVDVSIEIGEHRMDKTFSDIPVTSDEGGIAQPRTATVTLTGPSSVIAQLKPGDVKVMLARTAAANEPHLALPAGIQDQVTLKSIKPSQFSIPK